ncbi:chromosome segregation protein SMC, partial [Clostridium tarantellae]|nr:chromosome segregation protein SMC [Clostridium tarantellae]
NCHNYKNTIEINLFTKNDLNKELNIKITEKNDLNKLINNNINEKSIIEKKILHVENQLSKITGELHRLEANKDMLIKLENQYEGYNMSVRKIMESIEAGKVNIKKEDCTLLGEVIKANKGYERAIEISLGLTISNVITQNDKIAKILIDYLKKYKIGRATFLPLSIIKGRKLEVAKVINEQTGFLGIASDLISYEEKYDNIINYILGKTIICDNIDNALILAKKINYKYKIVTLAGEVVNSGGALTGGVIQQKNMGVISRKAEVESLTKKVVSINLEKNNIVNFLNTLYKGKKILECEKEKLTEKVYKNNLLTVDINNKIKSIENDIIKIKKDSEKLQGQLKNYNKKSKENYEQINFIEKKIKELENKDIKNKEEVKELELITKELSYKLNKIKENNVDFKIKKAKTHEIIENKEKDIKRVLVEERLLQKKIIELEKEILKNEENEKESYDSIENNKNFIEKEKINLILLEEKAKEYDIKKINIKEKLNSLESSLEILTVEIAKKDNEIHKNEIIYTKQDNEKNNYYLRLKEEFNTTFEEEVKNYKSIDSIEMYKNKINKLKLKISSLGSVNVNAIDEFKEISSKYKFITTEKDDLEKSQEQLINVIEEMTSKMKVFFRQNFNILNKYFDETFKELFKGGNAKLILQEGDELLGNIEIKVQPPGKKVQNINLMSGGEKVLSAIAILFAILKMKPTPFCILDEIEAALDDSNVGRYAEFLKKFSSKIQFIVITHRKGTMEVADIMYGVTMEEKGVSKLVSVDLVK